MKRRFRFIAVVAAVALAFSACGGDDESSEEQTADAGQEQTGQEDNEAFCNTYPEAQAAVIAASSGGDTSQIPSMLDELEADPPEEVAATIEEFIPQVRDAMETQDESVFESEGFQQADEELDVYVAENCGFESYEIAAVDYAFEGLPDNLSAGNVTFSWTNEGEEVHEMILVKFKDDDTKLEDLLTLSDRQAQKKVEFVNGFFGEAGTEDTETLPLEAGRYAALCFLPVGSTDLQALEEADGPPHVAKGMQAEFTVQ